MDNDQGSQEHYNELASEYRQADSHNKLTGQSCACYDLSKAIKEEFEEANPCQDANVFSDLMNAALSEVNWYEIAEALIDDLPEEEEKEEEEQ